MSWLHLCGIWELHCRQALFLQGLSGHMDFYGLIMSSPGYIDMHRHCIDIDKRFPSTYCIEKPQPPNCSQLPMHVSGHFSAAFGSRSVDGQGRKLSPGWSQRGKPTPGLLHPHPMHGGTQPLSSEKSASSIPKSALQSHGEQNKP